MALKMEEEGHAQSKECQQSLGVGNGKEMDSSLEPPERNVALLTPEV